MTATVEQHAAVGEAGLVGNLHEGQFYRGELLHGQALAQGLHSTEDAFWLWTADFDAAAAHSEGVGFLLLGRQLLGLLFFPVLLRFLVCLRSQDEAHSSLGVAGSQCQFHTRGFLHPLLEEGGILRYLRILGIVGNSHSGTEGEKLSGISLHALGKRNDTIVSALGNDPGADKYK